MQFPVKLLLLQLSDQEVVPIEQIMTEEDVDLKRCIVGSLKEFESVLKEFLPDVVVLGDTHLVDSREEFLDSFIQYKKAQNASAGIILLIEPDLKETVVNLLNKGADDYVLTNFMLRLPFSVSAAVKKNRLFQQKRKAEEEKRYLLDLLGSSLNEIFIFSSETLKFKYANEEALRNLGFSMEELYELTPMDLVEGTNKEEFSLLLDRISETKRGKIIESYGIRKDQSRYPIQIHLQLIEEHGRNKNFLANVLDISEMKVQEQQKELALYIQNTFNEIRDLNHSLDTILEGICRRQNLTAADFFAYNYDKTYLKRISSFSVGPELSENLGLFISQLCLSTQEPLFINKQLQKEFPENLKDEQHFKSLKSFPLNLGSETVGVINFYSEDSIREESFIHLGEGLRNQFANNLERKRTEDELTKIFDYSPDILSVASIDGYFKKINPSFSKLLGFSTEEILEIPFSSLIHQKDHCVVEEWKKNVHEQEVKHYENRFRTKNGDYKWISWSATAYLDKGLSFCVGRDITEIKNYLRAIEQRNEKLAEIAWEQSHVVRAPLARLMGCIHHLEDSEDYKEELLQNIKTSAYELDQIVKTIVSKAELIKNI